jgi:hypothetical protein
MVDLIEQFSSNGADERNPDPHWRWHCLGRVDRGLCGHTAARHVRVGDTVSLAARLETHTKVVKSRS